MKIAQPPYHADVTPHIDLPGSLWHCVIQRDGSREILAQHQAASKEDARCIALLELVRIQTRKT